MALLSMGWYWAAGKLGETVNGFTNQLASSGKVLKCAEQDVRGYPFRIGVFCQSVTYADPVSGITVTGNAVRTAAQLYRPGHLVAEADSPVDLTLPGLAPLTLEWRNMKSSSNFGTSGLGRISVIADAFKISANDFGRRDLLGTIDDLQFHARPSISGSPADLEISFSANGWLIDDDGASMIEPIDFNLQAEMSKALGVLQSGQDLLDELKKNGGAGKVSDLTFKTAKGGRVSISGPLEIGTNGLLTGSVVVNVDDPQRLVAYAASVFPPLEADLASIEQYLAAFADKSDGMVKIRDLKLTIKEGKVILGFFEIGQLPRLF